MTDLEINMLCAEAMGFKASYRKKTDIWYNAIEYKEASLSDADTVIIELDDGFCVYDPKNDAAQVMALVKKFHIDVSSFLDKDGRWVLQCRNDKDVAWTDPYPDVNSAICACVVEMQKEKP